MISFDNKADCCGCHACEQVCPKHCISMEADEEGFSYPHIETSKCVNCHLCENVCPEQHHTNNSVISVYAAKNKNESIRSRSSSGGTFRLLSNCVLAKGGIVYGCAFDDHMVAGHIAVEKEEDMPRLQSSKYVQSDVANTYSEAKQWLESGRIVLYSGTPCQIAALKNFLRKDYENLLLVDVLCHGVPSPEILSHYIKTMEEKFAGTMVSLNLRDKKKSWKRLYVNAEFDNGKNYFIFCGYDSYLSMFLNNLSQRPSCFACPFTSTNRQGDITLGDFWGIGKHIREMDDDKGTSMIIVNTEKGKNAWDEIEEQMNSIQTDIDTAIDGNKVLCTPPKKNPNRDAFYRLYAEKGYEAAAEKYAMVPSRPKQIYYNVMRKGLDFYRFIFHKTY